MTPTKIKARKMWLHASASQGTVITERPHSNTEKGLPVFVLDASRYDDLLKQMMAAFAKSYDGHLDLRDMEAALRSIGITKGAK